MLRLGSTGAAVAEVRARLAHLGLLDNTSDSADAVDVYDENVAIAIRTFQQERGITVDGLVGPETFRRLESETGPSYLRVWQMKRSRCLEGR